MGAEPSKSQQHYSVELTDEACYSLADITSKRVVNHVLEVLSLLEGSPFLGRHYDPIYEAAKPDTDCRMLYCEFLGIYYHADEVEHVVIVMAIVDQRRNPLTRF